MAHELVLERILKAPRDAVWRCWVEADLLKQWYCPKPWQVTETRMDVRVGGSCFVRMEGPGPDGAMLTQDCPGVYLEINPMQKIVTTDAYSDGWQPNIDNCSASGGPFMTAVITFADAPNGGTLYKAVARHWNAKDSDAHKTMGFYEGWGAAADQLEALAASL